MSRLLPLAAERGTCIITNMGAKDFEGCPEEARPPTEAELQQLFLPYEGFCCLKGIQTRNVVLHDIDIPSALVDYIVKNSIANFVVGAPSRRNALMRKFKNGDVPASLLKSAPESCSVYVISKGKVQYCRSANHTQTPTSNATLPKERFSIGTLNHPSSESEDTDETSPDIISSSNKVSPKFKLNDDTTLTPLSLGSHGNQTTESLNRDSLSDGCDFSWPNSFLSTDISGEKSKPVLECFTSSSCQGPWIHWVLNRRS